MHPELVLSLGERKQPTLHHQLYKECMAPGAEGGMSCLGWHLNATAITNKMHYLTATAAPAPTRVLCNGLNVREKDAGFRGPLAT